jgi:hypothetical protein
MATATAEADFSQATPIDWLRGNLANRVWRLTHLYWIRNEDGTRVKFTLRPAIALLFKTMHVRNIILKARQLGFTTFISVLFLDTCLFNNNVQAAMIAHRMDSAKNIFETKISYPYDNLPADIKARIPLKRAPSGHDEYSKTEIQFAHGSGIQVDVSVRSGTYQLVHVSEYGILSARNPKRAYEVKTGTLETAHKNALVFVESTAEGAMGEFYDMWDTASNHEGPLGPYDYLSHFFAWFQNPEYVLEPRYVQIRPKDEAYFETIERYWHQHGKPELTLTDEQRAWYVSKNRKLKSAILAEHPSTPAEAFQASTLGTYWAAQLYELQLSNPPQITDVPWDRRAPVYAFWDLGDVHTAILFVQFIQNRIHIFDCYEDNTGLGIPAYAKMIQSLPYNIPKDGHWAGPDIWGSNAKSMQTGKATIDIARENGIDFRKVEEHAVSDGIEQARGMLSLAWIDRTRCAVPLKMWRRYHKQLDEMVSTEDRPVFIDRPAKGPENHFADALRHLAMAHGYQTIGGKYIGNSRVAAAYHQGGNTSPYANWHRFNRGRRRA